MLGARVTSCLNELRTESVGRGRVVEIVISGEVKGFTGDWRGEKREKEQNRSSRRRLRRLRRHRSGDVSEETGIAEMGGNGKCTKTQNGVVGSGDSKEKHGLSHPIPHPLVHVRSFSLASLLLLFICLFIFLVWVFLNLIKLKNLLQY